MLASFGVPDEQFVAGILAGAAAIDRVAYATRWPDYRSRMMSWPSLPAAPLGRILLV